MLFAGLPDGWMDLTRSEDSYSALVYTMDFRRGVGVVVKRSDPLLVREALALIVQHLRPTAQ